MSMNDPLGDMLTRIRNAQRAKKSDVISPASKLRENVLEVLKIRVENFFLRSLIVLQRK